MHADGATRYSGAAPSVFRKVSCSTQQPQTPSGQTNSADHPSLFAASSEKELRSTRWSTHLEKLSVLVDGVAHVLEVEVVPEACMTHGSAAVRGGDRRRNRAQVMYTRVVVRNIQPTTAAAA